MPMSCPDTLVLRIDKMIQGGLGLARHEGQACLVKNAIAGELVGARVERCHSQYLEASAVDILEPSPERVQPPCPLYGECGGCHLQHMSYPGQLAAKTQAIEDCLCRIGKFNAARIPEPIASPAQLNYRIRASLKASLSPETVIGLYQGRSHSLVAIERCLLLHEQLNACLPLLLALYHEKPPVKARVQFIDLLLCRQSGTVLLRAWSGPRKDRVFALDPAHGTLTPCPRGCADSVADLRFTRTPDAFCQVNPAQNEAMITLVLEMLAPASGSRILELYCGSGNFSLFLARQGADVFGIEQNPAAVQQARAHALDNRISGCRFEAADAGTVRLDTLPFNCTDVLVNPPRNGCTQAAIRGIIRLRPAAIVYVSCNPATLARDARLLCKGGYVMDRIQPLDMFPQTCHIETVVKFVRSPQEP